MVGKYNRDVSYRKAKRKQRITKEAYWDGGEPWNYDYYDNLHQYSKNKIHCSCPTCSAKTRNKGRRKRGNYNPSLNYKHSEAKRQVTMDQDEENFLNENS